MKTLSLSFLLLVCLGASAAAATFTVDNTFDPGSGTCDAFGCTLREAITAANANPGADIIAFNIPAAGLQTITPASALPAITEAVTIDGYTQPGASANTLATGNDAVLLIELDGTSAGAFGGLILDSDNSVVRGLVINRFSFGGIAIGILAPGSNNLVEGNFIGTDAAGITALGNNAGVSIFSGSFNLVGGTLPAARNLISGHTLGAGVLVEFPANSNSIQGNYIGTDRSGTVELPNASGATIFDSVSNLIGGTEAGAGNLISGNSLYGVHLLNVLGSRVEGNLIGTNVAGASPLPNGLNGIIIQLSDAQIGGTEAAARNIISGNGGDGILMSNGSSGILVQGNYIGTDITGTVALGNSTSGVAIAACSNNIIGGVTAAARNIISGNSIGVLLQDGASANLVEGNYIGTDVTGNIKLGGSSPDGVILSDSPSNIIGGVAAGAGNLISGNGFGVQITLAGATGNILQGNHIGTNAAGTGPLPNVVGIRVFLDCLDTTIGGPGSAGNIIAFNEDRAIAINLSSNGTTILGNSIFANGKLGIDLQGGVEDSNGVTANDFPDTDTGANELQNYPAISGIGVNGTDRAVEGELASNPNTDYTLDFYSNSEVAPSGFGEGETYLGFLDVQTNAQGRVDFVFPLGASAFGQFITATATDPNGNTSEFSKASELVPPISRFLNISTRLRVQTGDNVLIGGFIITGNDPKEVIVRAIGPSLGDLGVEGFLANPILELHSPDGTVVTNNNWRSTQEADIIATGIPPSDDLESAIVATLDPGAYTAIVSGVNGGAGIGLVEAYDLGPTADSQLANISTRGFVETGDNVMIGGIIIGPDAAADGSVLVRALGPSLTAFGVPNALADPTLELRDGNGGLIASNNNWKSSQQAAIEATGLAPSDNKESAILATLASGNYTAIVLGIGDTGGVGLVEAYHLD